LPERVMIRGGHALNTNPGVGDLFGHVPTRATPG
jgi:hypothetical protein